MRFLPRRRLWRAVIPVALALVGVGVAAVVIVLTRPGNVSHPGVQFTAPQRTATTTRRRSTRSAEFLWPWYGYSATRTRDFVAPADLRPPLHVSWKWQGTSLLEFPPSIAGDDLYVMDDGAIARKIDASTGKVVWTRKVGSLGAATPALDPAAGLALMPTLSDSGHSPGDGRFVALSMRTGRIVWSHPLPAGSESSPIVSGHTVYFGDGGGTLWALDVTTGHVEWTFHARGAIKGGPALWHGDLFFGDYAGRAYALRAATGAKVWAVSTEGAQDGLGSGQFYATPSVAYGRVFMGNTDGRMYSFGAGNGALAWATSTGGYVYSSAAVADPKGVGPTVYAGSYDGDVYAFNARSGAVRWRHPAGGKVSGSTVVIGDVVYFSTLGIHATEGLSIATGDELFHFGDGAFTPAVADDHAIFLDGYNRIYELLPGPKPPKRAAHAKARAKARARARRARARRARDRRASRSRRSTRRR